MDTLGCAVCRSPGQNRPVTDTELKEFWRSKGVDGMAPEGMEVRSVIRCSMRINVAQRDVCHCETAWVRNAAAEEWRAIVRIPSDFVAGVSA